MSDKKVSSKPHKAAAAKPTTTVKKDLKKAAPSTTVKPKSVPKPTTPAVKRKKEKETPKPQLPVKKKKTTKPASPPPQEEESEEEEEEEQSESSEAEEQSDAGGDEADGAEVEEDEEEEETTAAARAEETAEVLFVQNIEEDGCQFEIDLINENCIRILSGPDTFYLGQGHTEHATELIVYPPKGYEIKACETGHYLSHAGVILAPFTIISAANPTFLTLSFLNGSRTTVTVPPYSTLAKLHVQCAVKAAFTQSSPTEIRKAFTDNKFVDVKDHTNCMLAAARLF